MPDPRPTMASITPITEGRERMDSTPMTNPAATAAIWPPRQPAIIPRRSRGEKR